MKVFACLALGLTVAVAAMGASARTSPVLAAVGTTMQH